jgi:VIT1/CCC1 family predicted Fe2+/Mn2+ transporter
MDDADVICRESYRSLKTSTRATIKLDPMSTRESIASVFTPYNIPTDTVEQVTTHLSKADPLVLADFLLRFQHEQSEPPASRALICALTIAMGYFVGGLIPLLPYFFVADVTTALWGSVGAMCFALFLFGYSKTCYNCGWRGATNAWEGTKGGFQMVVIGCVAAGCAMGLVRAFKGFAE